MKKVKFRKPAFNKERIQRVTRKVFKNSKIISYKKLEGGLVHSTFIVKILNPSKEIVIRLSKRKNIGRVTKNNQIMNYLQEHKIPVPIIYLQEIYYGQLITIMELIEGKNANKSYNKAGEKKRKVILREAGKTLHKIHSLKTPIFWVHNKHEIRNKIEWIKWTNERIRKYLLFVKRFLPKYYDFLKKEFEDFQRILISQKSKIRLVPLHWDYHLANMNVDSKGKVIGVFDFDNCMKGHDLADIGQTKYWLWFRMKNISNFKYFLVGYKKNFTRNELSLIQGYFLLHLVAVTRTIWKRQPRLTWIIEEHKKILDDFITH